MVDFIQYPKSAVLSRIIAHPKADDLNFKNCAILTQQYEIIE